MWLPKQCLRALPRMRYRRVKVRFLATYGDRPPRWFAMAHRSVTHQPGRSHCNKPVSPWDKIRSRRRIWHETLRPAP